MRRAVQGPDGELNFEIRDVYTAAGDTLTLERAQGNRTQRLVLHTEVGPATHEVIERPRQARSMQRGRVGGWIPRSRGCEALRSSEASAGLPRLLLVS